MLLSGQAAGSGVCVAGSSTFPVARVRRERQRDGRRAKTNPRGEEEPHVGSCALYLDAGRGDVGSSRPRRASRLGPGYVVMEMVAGDSSQEERRERRVVRAPDLIAFGPSGCRGGICIEHVIGFVRHERRLPDVGRRVATNRRCQPAHGIHSLNERGSCEIVAIP